jgi:hypothetical protein
MSTQKTFNQQIVSQHLNLDILKRNWYDAVHDPSFVLRMSITFLVSTVMVYWSPDYFITIQFRSGREIVDPILAHIPVINVSQYIFSLLYLSVGLIFCHVAYYPRLFMLGLQCYVLMTLMRLFTVYMIPLEPPADLILLSDPVLNSIFYGGHEVTKDLFFSGHTATMFLFGLVATQRYLKIYFFLATVVLGILVLLQHVHYSYDVIAAPFFAFICYYIMKKIAETGPQRYDHQIPAHR